MYENRKQRIRLKIVTNQGLKIMCTVPVDQTVQDFLPHLRKIYLEVKQENQYPGVGVKVLSIQRDGYLVAYSEIIGEIFDNDDEIYCEFTNSLQAAKNKNKKNKVKKKEELVHKQQEDIAQNIGKPVKQGNEKKVSKKSQKALKAKHKTIQTLKQKSKINEQRSPHKEQEESESHNDKEDKPNKEQTGSTKKKLKKDPNSVADSQKKLISSSILQQLRQQAD